MSPRTNRVRTLALTVGIAAAILPACRSPQSADGSNQRTPPMRLADAGGFHLVTMTAPHPGWDVFFDRSQKTAGPTRLLVTVRKPDPALLYPQVVVEKNVVTDVEIGVPVEVFARVVDHHARNPGAGYHPIAAGRQP